MNNNFSIGSVIKELRQLRGLSQKELCEGICSQSFLSKLERGDVSPSADTLYKMTSRLGVDMNYFFEKLRRS